MADCYRGDKRATESKQQLRKALFQLLSEKEWGKISVQDLTKVAGIHRTTFYQHYEDKFDLAQQLMDEMFDVMKCAIFAPVQEGDLEKTCSICIYFSILSAFARTRRGVSNSLETRTRAQYS